MTEKKSDKKDDRETGAHQASRTQPKGIKVRGEERAVKPKKGNGENPKQSNPPR